MEDAIHLPPHQFLPFIYLGSQENTNHGPASLTSRELGFSAIKKATKLVFSSKEQELDP